MKLPGKLCVWLGLATLMAMAESGMDLQAQEPADAAGDPAAHAPEPAVPIVPQLAVYNGVVEDRAGDTVEAAIRVYGEPEGGEPLWAETQQVRVGQDGRFSALLGAATEGGLPQALFAAGQARWVGVSIERGKEQPRTRLASVPYAMKAADAEALAGRAAAEFVTQEQFNARMASTTQAPSAASGIHRDSNPAGSGAANTVALWTSASNLGDSSITQLGTAAAPKIGVGTATPATTLDVAGASTLRGSVSIPATAVATAAAGVNSPWFLLSGSAYQNGGPAENQTFGWETAVNGNNTASPSALLAMLYQSGASGVGATSLTFSPTGNIYTEGTMTLGSAAATAGAGVASPKFSMQASSFNSSTTQTVPQTFAFSAVPAGNNTASPTANLQLLFGAGPGSGAPAATGLSFANNGVITFAPGQTFPGLGPAAITGITATSPLTGGGTSGNLSLGLNTSALETTLNGQYAQLGAANAFAQPITFASSQTFPAAPLENSLNGFYPQLGAASNTFTGSATFNGAISSSSASSSVAAATATGTQGATGVQATSDTGEAGYFANSSQTVTALYVTNSANTNGTLIPGAIFAVGSGTESYGVVGQGTSYGLYGASASIGVKGQGNAAGVVGNSTVKGGIGVAGGAQDGPAGQFISNGFDYATVVVKNASSTQGSQSAFATALSASTTANTSAAVYGNAEGTGSAGGYFVTNGDSGLAVYGSATGSPSAGGYFLTSGLDSAGVSAHATADDSSGVASVALGNGGDGVFAFASGAVDKNGVSPRGVSGQANSGDGVMGVEGKNMSGAGTTLSGLAYAGVWADAGDANGFPGGSLGALVATADNNNAGNFFNNSPTFPTLSAANSASGGPTGLFKVFRAATPSGSCGIGDGELICTGAVKTLATTGGGAKTVETYAVHAAENWMEDYGTGEMRRGVALVRLDPEFAETIAGNGSYHVFLTPNGDSKGLYAINKTAASFEVRESGGGTSSLSFDYKIVGKKRGYESARLNDVTERFRAEQARGQMPVVDPERVARMRAAERDRLERATAMAPLQLERKAEATIPPADPKPVAGVPVGAHPAVPIGQQKRNEPPAVKPKQ